MSIFESMELYGHTKHGQEIHTCLPSGKHRQKKSGLGLPTAFFITSVKAAVISTAKATPICPINEWIV
jgi:hypothetical protein